jgi:hypothetical protein
MGEQTLAESISLVRGQLVQAFGPYIVPGEPAASILINFPRFASAAGTL